jgi:prevent-host-death family protein
MIKAGIKEARRRFSEYIDMVQKGEEIVITKRDEPIARLVPVQRRAAKALTSRKTLRQSIKAAGKPLSQIVIESREERF